MRCPNCEQELVHRPPLWLCVECSYAETEQLHQQREREGDTEAQEPRVMTGEEVNTMGAAAQRLAREYVDPARNLWTTTPIPRNFWTTAIYTTPTTEPPFTTIPIQEAPTGGQVERNPEERRAADEQFHQQAREAGIID